MIIDNVNVQHYRQSICDNVTLEFKYNIKYVVVQVSALISREYKIWYEIIESSIIQIVRDDKLMSWIKIINEENNITHHEKRRKKIPS